LSCDLKVMNIFLNNPEEEYSVSEIMKEVSVCWVTARDSIVSLLAENYVINNDRFYKLNKDKFRLLSFLHKDL